MVKPVKDLSLVTWKTVAEGLGVLELASAEEGIPIRRVPDKEAFLVGRVAVVSPVLITIKRSAKDFTMHGYRATAITRGEDGKLAFGEILYEGICPGYCIRFASGNTKTRWEEEKAKRAI